jgi:Immunoglobulin I-set domain
LDIKWFKDDVEIPSHADYKTLYDKSTGQCVLEIPEVFAEDAGVFMIQAINEAGIGKCYCNLKVLKKNFQKFSRIFHCIRIA